MGLPLDCQARVSNRHKGCHLQSQDLDSVLRIHLKELGVNEEWVWKPDGPEKPGKQLGPPCERGAKGRKLRRDESFVKVDDELIL